MIRPFLIQGHRGAHGLRPENTLPGFEVALDTCVGSIETDVHLTADGVLVLIHDPILQGNSPTEIHQCAAEQVCNIIADRNPDPARFPEQRAEPTPLATVLRGDRQYCIPTLADLYEFVTAYAGEAGRAAGKTDRQRACATTVIIDVDIKSVPFRDESSHETVLEHVVDVVRIAGMVGRTWVRSFDHRCVRRLRELQPELTGVVLIEGTASADPVALVRAADAQVYAPDYLFLDEQQVRRCRDAGVRVLPWTVNAPADWARLISWGVDGITTDYPDRLAAWLAQPPANAK